MFLSGCSRSIFRLLVVVDGFGWFSSWLFMLFAKEIAFLR